MKKAEIIVNNLKTKIRIFYSVILFLLLFVFSFFINNSFAQKNSFKSETNLSEAQNDGGFVDHFEDDTEDLEALKLKALQQKKQVVNKKNLLDSFAEDKTKNESRLDELTEQNNIVTGSDKPSKKKTEKSDKSSVDLMEQIKNTLRFGTYDEQNRIIKRVGGDCRRIVLIEKNNLDQSKEQERAFEVIAFLKEEEYYENAFKKDASLLLANLELIKNCRIFEQIGFIERVLLEERRYMDYPEITRISLKIKAWEIISDFYPELSDTSQKNYSKLAEQYYRYERYHNNDARIKQAVLTAAGKLLPENLNQLLKQEYEQENNVDLKNMILETIGLYKDAKDIDFYDKIIREPEGTQIHRWISIIALTNYVQDQKALDYLKKYTDLPEPEIASRAYYVLAFYSLPLDYFIEATKNNDESIRIQAVEALAQFPLEEVEELLKYKSTHDNNELVRKKAKDILAQKNKQQTAKP